MKYLKKKGKNMAKKKIQKEKQMKDEDILKKKVVIAEGEVTGHAHRASNADIDEKKTTLKVGKGGSEVTHEEHDTHTLVEDDYDVGIVQELDPYVDEISRVRD